MPSKRPRVVPPSQESCAAERVLTCDPLADVEARRRAPLLRASEYLLARRRWNAKRKNRRAPATSEWENGSFGGLRAGRTENLRNFRLRRRRNGNSQKSSASDAVGTRALRDPPAPTPSVQQGMSANFCLRRRRNRKFPQSCGSDAVGLEDFPDLLAPAPPEQEISWILRPSSTMANASWRRRALAGARRWNILNSLEWILENSHGAGLAHIVAPQLFWSVLGRVFA